MTTTPEPPPTLFDAATEPLPVLPYAGTSGWSGSTTSETRAVTADANGTTSNRQRRVLTLLDARRDVGMTWRDLADALGAHHGTASGALSALHKAGLIARLTETRRGCQVYVGLDHVNGRPLAPHRPNAATRALVEVLDNIEAALLARDLGAAIAIVRATREAWQ